MLEYRDKNILSVLPGILFAQNDYHSHRRDTTRHKVLAPSPTAYGDQKLLKLRLKNIKQNEKRESTHRVKRQKQ